MAQQAKLEALVEWLWPCVLQNVDAHADTVGRVDQSFFVDDRVVVLDRVIRISGWRRRHKEANLLDLRRSIRNRHIDQTVNPNPSIEETPDESILQLSGCGTGKIGMQIVGTEPATSRAKIASVFWERCGPDDDWVRLLANIHQPNQFWRVAAVLPHRFVRDGREAAAEQRLHRVCPGGIRRRKLEATDRARGKTLGAPRSNFSQPRNIQDDLTTVHVANVSTVLAVRVNLHVMGAITVVDGMPPGQTARQAVVLLLGSGKPPPANLARVPGIAKVHYHVELVVFWIRRIGIACPAGEVGELPIDKPQPVDAA